MEGERGTLCVEFYVTRSSVQTCKCANLLNNFIGGGNKV